MWISIKDRLPDPYVYVLVYHFSKGTDEPCPMSVAYYDGEKWVMFQKVQCCPNAWAMPDLGYSISGYNDIDMWHPLPPSPNDEHIRDATEMVEFTSSDELDIVQCPMCHQDVVVNKDDANLNQKYRSNQTCRFCDDPKSILTKDTCCTGCSRLRESTEHNKYIESIEEIPVIKSKYLDEKLARDQEYINMVGGVNIDLLGSAEKSLKKVYWENTDQ